MIDMFVDALANLGMIGAGGLSVLSLGLWLRRAQKVATYLRVAGIVAIMTGVGALFGVVNLGRLYELIFSLWRLLPLSLAGAIP